MPTQTDVEILARTLYGEARGEPYLGKMCVGWVVKNRAAAHFRGTTVADCCQSPAQFSCWNTSDPNYQLINSVNLGNPVYRECFRAALEALDATVDPTHGATHYHTIAQPKWAKTWPPSWAQGHTPCATVGEHVFYRGIA